MWPQWTGLENCFELRISTEVNAETFQRSKDFGRMLPKEFSPGQQQTASFAMFTPRM